MCWIYLFLFLLPWQTRWIIRPGHLANGIWPAMRSFSEAWEYGHLGIFASEILLWVIIFLILVEKKNRVLDWLEKNNLVLAIICPLAIYFFVTSPYKSLTLQTFLHYLAALAFFFILKALDSKESRSAALAFIYGVSWQAALGIYQFLTQSTWANRFLGLVAHEPWLPGAAVLENSAGRWLRAYGGLPHPNILGGYLVVSLILFIIVKEKCPRIIFWGLYFLQLTALFFTFSRSAWLALAVALIIFYLTRKQTSFIIAAVTVFVFYSLLFYPLVTTRLAVADRLEINSKIERINQYGEAWQVIRYSPWLGVGPGFYTAALHQLQPAKPLWAVQPVHNVLVLVLAEWGVIGLGVLVFLTVRYLKIKRDFYKFLSIITLIILSLFDHYLLSLWSGLLLTATALGLALDKI